MRKRKTHMIGKYDNVDTVKSIGFLLNKFGVSTSKLSLEKFMGYNKKMVQTREPTHCAISLSKD